jgi:hypothetical protein
MLDSEATALLRAVLEEVCANISPYETGTRTHAASKILEGRTQARQFACSQNCGSPACIKGCTLIERKRNAVEGLPSRYSRHAVCINHGERKGPRQMANSQWMV